MSSNAETFTKSEVTTVEREYALCPHCRQEYESDEYITFVANPQPAGKDISGDFSAELCPACARSVFDWDAPEHSTLSDTVNYIVTDSPKLALLTGVVAIWGVGAGALVGGLIGAGLATTGTGIITAMMQATALTVGLPLGSGLLLLAYIGYLATTQ